MIPQNNNEKKCLVIDLFGVLFLLNKFTILKDLGIWNVVIFYVKFRTSPLDHAFALLDQIRISNAHEFQDKVAYKNHYLPNSLCLWQQGRITGSQASLCIFSYLETLPDTICRDRKLMVKLIEYLCKTEMLQKALKLNEHLYQQLYELKKSHRLYILSNIDLETWNYIKNTYPHIIGLFDGNITSSEKQLLKPNKEIFNALLTTYKLEPHQCLLIDDQEENCSVAQKLGMGALLYQKNCIISDYSH